MFDARLNSDGAKCARDVPELRIEKWLNSNLTCGTRIGGRSEAIFISEGQRNLLSGLLRYAHNDD
jgi:hypothetical protein